ncbi:MAG TPA: amidohydrolase family protein [Streptosporangiaceae bacterium]
MTYDLLVKGGHVLDPGQGLDARLDIGITGGTISEIGPDLPASEARRVIEVKGTGRYVLPGLIDLHTHVAHGATTEGVGMGCCDPDAIGVRSGVTTVVDCGSVGVANIGVFPAHILPKATTRVITYVNAGSFAHTMPGPADVNRIEDIDRSALEQCAEHNPGLISGVKLRLVGPALGDIGEEVIKTAKQAARDLSVPLMVHIGDFTAKSDVAVSRSGELTRFLLRVMEPGDVLTHLCTPNAGRVLDSAGQPYPEVAEARATGVILDSALGRGNFGYQMARAQADLGLHPDTISSDLTAMGQSFHSLLECMAKFMAVGYSLSDVVKATTARPAEVLGLADQLGAIAVGRDADLSIVDLVEGDFAFTDTTGERFTGGYGLAPVHTLRAGQSYAPDWGTHPWGWLPAPA